MIPKRVIVNLFVFFGLTGVLIAYGFFSLVHNPLKQPMTLYSYIDDTGGVRTGFTVALRGVPIGHVRGLGLTTVTNPDGSPGKKIKLTLSIDEGVVVPDDAQVQVERANPLGEQQVDLLPTTGHGQPVRRNAVLPPSSTPTPPEVGQVVAAADKLFESVPTEQLGTVVHELSLAFKDRGQDLRTLVESGDTFSRNTVAYEAAFRSLLDNSPPVLDTVASVGPQLSSALRNTAVLADLIDRRKYDLINLAHTGTSFAQVATKVMDDNTANLACLAHDFGDLGANLGAKPNIDNLDATLLTNRQFFGPIDSLSPKGHAASLGPGSPERNDQTWLRVRTLLPPQQPPAISYPVPHRIPDTYPGAACLSVFGNGVPAGAQADAAAPEELGRVIPAPVETVPVERRPGPTPEGAGTGSGNVFAKGSTPAAPPKAPAGAAPPAAQGMGPTGRSPGAQVSGAQVSGAQALVAGHAARSAHPEGVLFVGAGLLGLGTLERRELRKLRRSRRRARRGRLSRASTDRSRPTEKSRPSEKWWSR
ncbi:MAG: hypothetical protein NVS3B12_33170 [Acidimicrobiales bacterium]